MSPPSAPGTADGAGQEAAGRFTLLRRVTAWALHAWSCGLCSGVGYLPMGPSLSRFFA